LAALEDSKLVLRLGYAHPIILDIPEGVTVSTPTPQKILLKGIDKPVLTQFAANIRKWRKPEPYNQKGVFVGDETIKKKEGKKR
jgi:large subunit ribosomal protein L6